MASKKHIINRLNQLEILLKELQKDIDEHYSLSQNESKEEVLVRVYYEIKSWLESQKNGK